MSVASLHSERLKRQGFTEEDIDRAHRFGRTIAALYAYIGIENAVVTPRGQGTLHRVIEGEALVLLARGRATRERKSGQRYVPMTVVNPEEVRPV